MTSRSRTTLLVLWAIAYVGLGCLTEFRLVQEKPIPESLMSDFVVYREALNRALEGGDPYAVRYIGPGFFYPPPALLIVGLLASVGRLGFRAMFATHFLVTLALMGIMVWGLSRYYGLKGKAAWYWWVLALGSAPLMEVLHLGQINVLTEFGIFLLFVAEASKPILSGGGLALAAITKVAPIVFTGYLALRRRLREILAAGLVLTAAAALAYASFGPSAFVSFPGAFLQLGQATPRGMSLVSLIAGECPESGVMSWACASARGMQFALGVYLVIAAVASGVAAQRLKQKEPFFIVLGLATMLYPNVLWYHHLVFFIVPVLLWLGYTHERPLLLAWVLSGMLIIQVDRWYLTRGLLIHAFGHLSMLIVVGGQIRDLVRRPVLRGTYAEEIP